MSIQDKLVGCHILSCHVMDPTMFKMMSDRQRLDLKMHVLVNIPGPVGPIHIRIPYLGFVSRACLFKMSVTDIFSQRSMYDKRNGVK